MGILGVLSVKVWKYCVLSPKRHYPAWVRVCWFIACQNRLNGLSSSSVERFCVHTNKEKKWVVTLAIWGEVTPAAILTKCRMRWDMVDVIMCATFRECWLRGVFVSVLSSRPHCSAHCQPSLVLVSMTSPNGWPQIVWWLILMVRGVSLPSPIDLTRRPHNTGHTTVWPCDKTSKVFLY